MRILHIGSGFRPMRLGGLVAYAEDLTDEQARRGDEVAYFFSGRQFPFGRGPRLKTWRRDRVAMFEIVNSPLFDHGRQPDLELAEPRVERIFEGVLRRTNPDVVHVQELAGLPTSVLDIATRTAPVVMTLHDYFPLCANFKLIDSEQRVCLRRAVGEDCLATVTADPRPPGVIFDATVRFELRRPALVKRFESPRVTALIDRLASSLSRNGARHAYGRNRARLQPAAFQRRRDVNVERLNALDRLVAVSSRVGEIYAQLGVDAERIVTTQLPLAHIERLRPRLANGRAPVTFATLGGAESVPKGSRLLLDAARALAADVDPARYRLLVFGFVDQGVADALAGTPGVELRGSFAPSDLDDMLDEVDVGIIPSIWEEAYGLVGAEFLAKGIPVIANAIGGIVDYAREGETAWLNRSCSAEELSSIMGRVIEQPTLVSDLNEMIRVGRESIVMPLSRHAAEMDELYRDVIATRAP
jgi:glycosyltransferase involved in cell wall biosynthesis